MKIENSKAVLSKDVEKNYTDEENYNEKLMRDHSEIYSNIKKSILDSMKKELTEIVGEEAAVKICDVLPVNKETIKTILLHFNDELEEEKVDKCFSIVKKYLEG